MTDQPSGRGGGPMVGPSWFEGVGGRVMSQGYMQQTRNDSLQGLLESLRGQDKEKDVGRRIERDLSLTGCREEARGCASHTMLSMQDAQLR